MSESNEHITSEERLLKLLRKKNHSDKKEAGVADQKGQDQNASVKVSQEEEFDFFKLCNHVLVWMSIGILGYVVFNQIQAERNNLIAPVVIDKKQSEVRGLFNEFVEPVKRPFSYYEEELQERDFFKVPWETADNKKEVLKVELPQLEKKIKILGIILDANPQVIVEDIKTQQTFFLSIGESLEGIILEEIHENKVIFNYNNQKVEMVP